MNTSSRSPLGPLVALVVLVAVIGAWWFVTDASSETVEADLPSNLSDVLSTVFVTRANVADEGSLAGELRYQDPVTFIHRIDPVETVVTQQVGTGRQAQTVSTVVEEPGQRAVTALPAPGDVISPGDVLYETDSTPVFTMSGALAAWRTMSTLTQGTDVAQLQTHLMQGGWAADDFVIDGLWTSQTSLAVEQWQIDTGQSVTGTVALGDVWFIDGPIRITGVEATEGLVIGDGDELFSYTSDRRAIEVSVSELPEGFVNANDLTTRLPNGASVPATVRSVSGTDTGFDLVLDLDLSNDSLPAINGLEVTTSWTVGELVDALTLPPEALRRMDNGTYVVDVLDGDVLRPTEVQVLGQAGRVVAIDGLPERTEVLTP